ncbi:hypothetical protein DASC09_016860 [Saccharomycopsis crataegensis]|uniref:Uncharacterized protein n=1 Tax=Saccharomycopsis crataegensis TaxID=43959 RepID=A0AAV5QI61_9ASCO|nr:hypothetical protein DASC09_016860 [Saccharomycopsis crataegensis]
MPAIASLSGWALFGTAVRAYQIGLKQRPWSYKPMGYVYSALFWVGAGYAFYSVKESQEKLLEKRVATLLDARAKRLNESLE